MFHRMFQKAFHGCFIGALCVFQRCFKCDKKLHQLCFKAVLDILKGISRVFYGQFMGVSMVFYVCFTFISSMLKYSLKFELVFKGGSNGLSRVLIGCFMSNIFHMCFWVLSASYFMLYVSWVFQDSLKVVLKGVLMVC